MGTVLKSCEEDDLFQRSKKKVRPREVAQAEASKGDTACVNGSQAAKMDSYKEKLKNLFGEEVPEKIDFKTLPVSKDQLDNVKIAGTGLEIPLSDEEWSSWSQT